MAYEGIAPKEFFDRIAAGDVTEDWPFADLLPRGVYDPADPYVLVGRLSARRAGHVFLGTPQAGNAPKRVRLGVEPAQGELWGKLAGVGVALQVSRRPVVVAELPEYTVEQVLAVEPPMTHPAHMKAPPLGGPEDFGIGYGHGVVLDSRAGKEGPGSWGFSLSMSGVDRPAGVGCDRSNVLLSSEGALVEGVRPGDVLRARFSEYYGNEAYRALGAVYLIGQAIPSHVPDNL